MKRILSTLLTLATLAVAFPLYAASTPLINDSPSVTLFSAVTVSNSVTKTTGLGESLWIPTHDLLGLELQVTGALATSTGAVTLKLSRSVDGKTAATGVWENSGNPTLIATANGTNLVVVTTNFPAETLGAFPYVKVASVANASSVTGANISATARAVTKTVVTK